MQHMDELKAPEDSDWDTCVTDGSTTDSDRLGGHQRRDSIRPNYRSRLVCQETLDCQRLTWKIGQRLELRLTSRGFSSSTEFAGDRNEVRDSRG